MINKLSDYIKSFKVLTWIYITLFSLIAAKSLFLSPFSLIDGVLGIIMGFLILGSTVCTNHLHTVYAAKSRNQTNQQ